MFPNLRLLFLRFCINYPSFLLFFFSELKQRKKRRISLFRRLHSKPSSLATLRSRAFVPASSILRGTTRKNSYARHIWMFSQITQNLLRLARNTHIVLQTTQTVVVIKGSLSPKVPSFVFVPTRVHR